MLKQVIAPILYFLLCIPNLVAQNPSYTNYNTKDGLPSNEVYDVEIGPKGMLWFSTDRGVCTYDGYTFKSYTTSDGLADNTNFEIFKDSRDRLWFSGFSGRLSIYENGRFSPYMYNDSLINLLGDYWVADFIEHEDGSLFFAPYKTRGVAIYSIGVKEYPKQIKTSQLSQHFEILNLLADSILISGPTAFSYTNRNINSTVFPLISKRINSSWIFFNKRTVQQINQEGQLHQQTSLQASPTNLFTDHQSHLWLCTSNGLYSFIDAELKKPPKHYFKNYHITSCIQDAEGNFWASTHQNGVLFIPTFEIEIIKPKKKNPNNERFLSVENLKKHIFFGTAYGRIIAINSSGDVEVLQQDHRNNAQKRFLVKNDNQLFSYEFDLVEKENKIISKEVKNAYAFRKKMENEDYFMFSTEGFSISTKGQDRLENSSQFAPHFTKKINIVQQDKSENIWLGTLDGLYKIKNYDYANVSPFLFDQIDTFRRINDIIIDKNENLWIATIGNGLFYLADQKLTHLNKTDGLLSEMINQIDLLNDSTICLATNKGLNVFNYQFENKKLQLSTIKSITAADGLSSNYINDVNFWNGRLWLATDNSINAFNPDILNRPSPIIPISINNFFVNDSSYNINNSLSFKYNQNDIFINFTGISFRKESEKPFYRYRLNIGNKQQEWFYTNEKNIRYNDLPPGKYTFEVSAQNKSGEWNNSPATINWKIKQHFIQTNWFKTLMAIAALAFVAFIIYFQIRRIKSKESAKRKLQNAQLRTHEAKLAALRNQMNPHFVFNSLNSIQNFIFKKDTEKANYYLSKFSGLMRKSLQYARLDYISIKNELAFLKDYLELESMRFPNKFKHTINIEEELDTEFLLIPSLLLQPILENAVKHAFKEKKSGGLIEIEVLKRDEKSLDLYIRDNGPGLLTTSNQKPKSKHKSLGLEIIRNRILLLNESKQSANTYVSFINRSDTNKSTTGLEVHFILPILYKL